MKVKLRLPRCPEWLRSLAVRAYLRYIAFTGRPIVLGPWRSELGFEVLYWLPFLHWALQYAKIPPDRCLALSRGGMGKLYPATHHADLYALRGIDAVRIENVADQAKSGKLKQEQVTAWDRRVCQEAAEKQHGAGVRFHVLHPSWMYWLFDGYWEEYCTVRHVQEHAIYAPLSPISLPEGFELPGEFIAVRFYERATFPLNGELAEKARQLVQTLATHLPVVLLNNQLFTDDHSDLPIAGPNIYVLKDGPPEENLLVQMAVLQRAKAFVGTYGGVAQAALRYKVASLSFFTTWQGTAQAHRSLSQHLSQHTGVPFEVATISVVNLWAALLVGKPEPVPTPPATEQVAA